MVSCVVARIRQYSYDCGLSTCNRKSYLKRKCFYHFPKTGPNWTAQSYCLFNYISQGNQTINIFKCKITVIRCKIKRNCTHEVWETITYNISPSCTNGFFLLFLKLDTINIEWSFVYIERSHVVISKIIAFLSLSPKAPISTKVVCFSRLVKC